MLARLHKHTLLYIGAGVLILSALVLLYQTLNPKEPNWTTAQVERGTMNEVVSVSGFIEAKNTAELAFPSIGTVTGVFAEEGQKVVGGEVLLTLASTQLVAQRDDAQAELRIAQAQYDKLIAGETTQTRAIADTNLRNAEQALARTITQEREKVSNARKILLSSELSALAKNINEDATPPTVSGSYTCENEGVYTLEVYSSNAYSDFSYRFSGLETGTTQAGVSQASALGSCGLFVQFSENNSYNGSVWTIAIPNTKSEEYIANANAYATALTEQAHNVAKAEDARVLAMKQTAEVTAGPRGEEIREAEANIDKAKARIATIDAQIEDRSIVAPFAGTITSVGILKGETAPTTPVVTVLAFDAFELKARIPEIDINKVHEGQDVEVIFDAETATLYKGTIAYVSPLATKIDGVAYFEATISLFEVPTWIRSGLNADVNITTSKKENILRIPKRFLIENTDRTHSVFVANGREKETKTIEVITLGNDGFAEISGLKEGDIIIAP